MMDISDKSGVVVSIIVVSYNTREMTLECLRSILKETQSHTFEVVVLDNMSSDGSFTAIESEFGSDPRFVLIESHKNLGFAGGNNLAVEKASGDFLLLLNPDTVVLDRALDALVDFARERPKHRIWGGRTLFADGSLNPYSCWGPYTLWSIFTASVGFRKLFPKSAIFNPRAMVSWKRDSIREVAIVTGCLFLIDRSLWDELKGFDPEFFMYGEEADLCMRASALGARPIITPKSTIIHYAGASEHVRADKLARLLDAEVRLFRRNMSSPAFKLALWMTKSGVALRAATMWSLKTLGIRKGQSVWGTLWNRRSEWSSGSHRNAE